MSYFYVMTRGLKNLPLFVGFLLVFNLHSYCQRVYKNASVLASGNWYKIATSGTGIYKIDLSFLNSLGVNVSNLNSASIRLFGNGGGMLPENCNGLKIDDLEENAIWIEDGGDGILNGTDYILFFAESSHKWLKDSANKRFLHQKNLYSEQAFYFLNIGGTGKRILSSNVILTPNITISSFNERYFYELDTINFLSSGKQWFGEEFSDAPGKTLNRLFPISLPNLVQNQPATIVANCLARSFGTGSRFTISANNQNLSTIEIPPVAAGPYDQFARVEQSSVSFIPASTEFQITFSYQAGSINSQGWLDWFEIFARRNLTMAANQLAFRDWNSVAGGNVGEFVLQNATNSTQVWDVTNGLVPIKMQTSFSNNELRFTNDCSQLHEYIAFNNSNYLLPVAVGKINNQNLHNSLLTDFLMITHTDLLPQAQRLAQFHQQNDNLKTIVVTTDQVFNEFSSGSPDPTAIRDFVKMYFDKAGADSSKRPKYLLLFGDGSFDYKARIRNNTNLVPAYQSNISLDPLSTYTSDDYFGFLNDDDDINGNGTNLLDIGIGRIPAKNINEAKAMVDKILNYTNPKTLGPWRNEFTFVADDEDANLHLQDAEVITSSAASAGADFNNNKIYLDAFQQQSTPAGSRYPEVNFAINNKIFNGTLIWNYNGHGGFRRLAEEVVLDQEVINTFNNPDKLPLFITATCDVAPYDNPLVSSIGENLLLREKTGAIALMTTTRLVFAFSNRVMNKNYLETALQKKPDGTYPSLGEAVKAAKNTTYLFFGDIINNRKFTLLGDPAVTLAFPVHEVKTTAINRKPISSSPDTLKALSLYTIEGVVTDNSGVTLPNFNGIIYPTIFEKAQSTSTKGNDAGSIKTEFVTQDNVIFKGKAKVIDGKFQFDFIVPKDINYQFGSGKLSYYAEDGKTDGNGAFTNIIIGGSGDSSTDKEGPDIKVFLNDEKFVSGGVANETPILLLKLTDSSGINIIGTGIGHDLEAILDHDPQKKFVLNKFYESDVDNFRKGVVRFQLPPLAEGIHSVTVKAWDAANNSNEASLEFRVVKEQHLTLNHVFNYPNPFTTHTNFWFEHNRAGEELRISIQIFTVTGKLVKTLRSTIISSGNRSNEVEWNGRDEFGSRIGRGVYIYRLRIQTADGKSAQKLEKLYIL